MSKNKLPRKNKQWVEEASKALDDGLAMFFEKYPKPTDEENLQLLNYAVPLAAINRDIKDVEIIKGANKYVYLNLEHYFHTKKEDEEVNFSVLFLLAYLDAHISFEIITQKKAEEIMQHIAENYDLS